MRRCDCTSVVSTARMQRSGLSSPTLPRKSRLRSAGPTRSTYVPFKKALSQALCYLTTEEVEAILATGPQNAERRRDYLVLALLYDTGGRSRVLNYAQRIFAWIGSRSCSSPARAAGSA